MNVGVLQSEDFNAASHIPSRKPLNSMVFVRPLLCVRVPHERNEFVQIYQAITIDVDRVDETLHIA